MHRETTENIRVTVIPFYMGMRVGLCYILLFCDLFNLYVWVFFFVLRPVYCLKVFFAYWRSHFLAPFAISLSSLCMSTKLLCHNSLGNKSCAWISLVICWVGNTLDFPAKH